MVGVLKLGFIALVIGCACAIALLAIREYRLENEKFKDLEKENKRVIELLYAKVLTDLITVPAAFAKLNQMTSSQKITDAGQLLNEQVRWIGIKPRNSEWSPIPKSVEQKFKEWGDGFLSHRGELDAFPIDFSWLIDLEKFDYWDMDIKFPTESIEESFRSDPFVQVFTDPSIILRAVSFFR